MNNLDTLKTAITNKITQDIVNIDNLKVYVDLARNPHNLGMTGYITLKIDMNGIKSADGLAKSFLETWKAIRNHIELEIE